MLAPSVLLMARICVQGTVRLLFQPAEEGGAGGDLLVKEGEGARELVVGGAQSMPMGSMCRNAQFTYQRILIWCLAAAAGALEGVKAAFGMHVWPTLPSGAVRSRAGTIMVTWAAWFSCR